MPAGRAVGSTFPNLWITGPDPFRHKLHHPWQLMKAQANFRDEEFTLTFEQFFELWKDDWHNRGRQPENVCMSRHDFTEAWSFENCYIVSRKEHLRQQGLARKGIKFSKKNKARK